MFMFGIIKLRNNVELQENLTSQMTNDINALQETTVSYPYH
jgi:hypothetical protein